MVVYDLICARGHRFEGWFDNLNDLSAQLAARILVCPVCGDGKVSRRPSTFGLVKAGRTGEKPAENPPAPPVQATTLEMFQRWAEFSRHLEREFDDVGHGFADEALKMHYGVTKRRGIRGLSTEAQEEMLRKEGIEFFKVPLLARKNHTSTN
ncbi:MAG: DUF1178 family protein [Candidatus Adiutrix sp.]|jgi:hypothetical protein|nr:DUF1178 family protein [Candidatus Adiutrix sp.]